MRIIKFLRASLVSLSAALALSSCGTSTTDYPSVPREMTCTLEYTGPTYAPIHTTAPYKYALYDINGGFIAYLDTTRLVVYRMEPFMGKVVVVRGPMVKRDGENVVCAESLRLAR